MARREVYEHTSFESQRESANPISLQERAHAIKATHVVLQKKRRRAKRFLLETFSYGLFMVLFCIVTYNFRSSWAFNISDMVRASVISTAASNGKTWSDIHVTADFYQWAREVLFPTLQPSAWYNGEAFSTEQQQFMRLFNYNVGAVRFRQLRVKKNIGCVIPKAVKGLITECYPPYKDGQEETASYGPSGVFQYRSAKQLCNARTLAKYCTAFVMGQRSDNRYTANGYVWDFMPRNLTGSLNALRYLEDNNWIGEPTRAVMIDFTLFNPNINMLVATQLTAEFYATGTVVTSSSIKPLALMTLETQTSILELVGEIVLVAFIAMYIVLEVLEFLRYRKISPHFCTICMRKRIVREGMERVVTCYEESCRREFNPFTCEYCPRCQREIEKQHICWRGYFQDTWNILDIINQGFFIAVFAIRFDLRTTLMHQSYDVGDQFFLLYPLAWRYSLSNYLNSVNALLCFTKIFKYLRQFRSLSSLVLTLSNAKAELGYFVLIFFIIFMGFAMSFHMAFGDDIYDYRHWIDASLSLWRTLLGDFDYSTLQESNRALAPIFFISFHLLVFFVLANMFIAIINGAYEEASEDVREGKEDFLSSSLQLFFRDVRRKLSISLFRNYTDHLGRVHALLDAFEDLATLDETKKDNIRMLRREIDHDPDNQGLLAKIVLQFANKPFPEPVTPADYLPLKRAVIGFKRMKRVEKYKENIFEDDEYDELIGLDEDDGPSNNRPEDLSVDYGTHYGTTLQPNDVPGQAPAPMLHATGKQASSSFFEDGMESTGIKRASKKAAWQILNEIEQRQQSLNLAMARLVSELEDRATSREP
eukprot:TRINITY_DN936_c0_g1_i1.p1 TRINITY_DN936_c0_g1~~TRINITY_DN936_c0_g1_i1.p1  ORF type:complete len:820 (+),score=191.59 TRINITY_DN936_c0_g1_i1:53-2512(+)